MPRLTESFARKAPFLNDKTIKHWDSEVKGLVLFVGKRSKTWYFQKDVAGRTKRILIGRSPQITAETARLSALDLSVQLGRGTGKLLQVAAPTLRTAMDTYLARPKLRSERYRRGMRQSFERDLSDWLALPLDEITKPMVAQRHLEMRDRPSSANHTLKYFRTVWNHARRVANLPEAPTIAIEWYEEHPPGTIIDDFLVWKTSLTALPNPIHRSFFVFLLLTGLRRAEALTLTWEQIHDDRIHLPMTKNGRSFDLPIIPLHLEVLEPLRRLHRKWVFPSPKSVVGHVTNTPRLAWSPHTHRRTFATAAMEAGVLEEVVARLLNHTPISITGRRYVRPSLDALRPSMEQACEEVVRRIGDPRNLTSF